MSDAGVIRTVWRARVVALRLRADDRLAEQAAVGDTDAFAVLYERHHKSLYRYCRSIVGDPEDAADALQTTMTRALSAIGDRDPAAPVRAWLFRIAHNESISLIRRRRPMDELDPESVIAPDVEATAEQRQRLGQLVTDLQQLSERQRGALLMRELGGLGHAEIATALEASEASVKQSIFEARSALHDFAAGREMRCELVRRELSDGDGRTARSRRLRGHLRTCDGCRSFRDELKARQNELRAVAPMLPTATAAALLEAIIGGGGGGLLVGAGVKAAAVAATAVAGVGAVTYTATVVPDRPPRPEPKTQAVKPPEPEPRAPAAQVVAPATAAAPAAAPDPPPDGSQRADGPTRRDGPRRTASIAPVLDRREAHREKPEPVKVPVETGAPQPPHEQERTRPPKPPRDKPERKEDRPDPVKPVAVPPEPLEEQDDEEDAEELDETPTASDDTDEDDDDEEPVGLAGPDDDGEDDDGDD
jgi:RNA polymerase sigma factor (sigma-70 family)